MATTTNNTFTATTAAAGAAITVENRKAIPKPTPKPSGDANLKLSTGPPPLPAGTHILPYSACRAAAETLAQAFDGDAVADYFVHTPDREHWTREQKCDLHVRIFEFLVYAHMMNGLVLGSGGDAEGGWDCVSLWCPPNTNIDSTYTLFRSGLWRLYYLLTPLGRNRFFSEFFPLLHDTKLAVLGPRDADSYYLVYIGTRPAGRGKGLAKRMIQGMSERADAEGRATYLEGSNVANRRLYEGLGFAFVRRIGMGEGERVGMEIMVREPRGVKARGT